MNTIDPSNIGPANNSRTNILKGVSTLDFKQAKIVLLFLLLIVAFGGQVFAGHSILDRVDPSFNPEIQTNSYGSKWVNQIQALPDGKILVLGGFNTYDGVPVGKLVRLNADGSLDPTFNNQTVTASATAAESRIFLQPDGKIVLMCAGLVAGGQPPKQLLRLNSDGSFDPSFNFTQTDFISRIVMDSLGRLMVMGSFTTPNGPRSIIRLNNNGSLDNSFNFTPAAGALVQNIAAQGSRLVVLTDIPNSTRQIYRLNEDGSEDSSFTPLVGIQIYLTAVQPDNKILYQQGTGLLRLNENGGSDGTFQSHDVLRVINDSFLKFASNGKMVIVYQPFLNSAQINRFLPNGAVDPSFTQHTQPWLACFTIASDDSIVIGDAGNLGGGNPSSNNFVKLTPGGAIDPTFNPGGAGFQTLLPGVIQAIETHPNGKILLGGKFDLINDIARYRLARLNADSTVDTSFQINTSGTGNYFSVIRDVYQIRVQLDGKIIVSGFFDYVLNGKSKTNFVRLNPDGSIDATFNLIPPIPDWSQILTGGQNRFATYNDGKLMVGTSKSTNGGLLGPVRLTAGGALDTSFSSTLNSASPFVYIDDVTIQPDGKIIASGTHGNNSNAGSFVARFNANGSLDPTFPYTEEPNRLYSKLALLPSGKILISKYAFTGGAAKIQRLNSNGSLDTSFNSVSFSDSTARLNALLVLPNGKIFVGGKFTVTVNGQPGRNLLQLNEDGSFAPTVYNLDEEVLSLAADSDGRVLVGGGFTVIGANGEGTTRSFVARLTDSPTRFDFDGDGKADVSVFRPSNGNWYLSQSQNGLSVQNFGLNGDVVTPGDFDGDGKTDLAIWRPSNGMWWYKSTVNGGFYAVQLGQAGDIPVAEDFNGDGKTDFVVYRPSTGVWHRMNSFGQYSPVAFGTTGDIPLVGDFDGDGKSDPAIFRPSTGTWWYMSSINNLHYAVQWGANGDIPVPGDYDGDGKTNFAYFRPSNSVWYILNTSNNTYTTTIWGFSDDKPTPADYDGDGKTDIAIYRPSNGMWFALRSTSGSFSQQFGLPGDKAALNAFIPVGGQKLATPRPVIRSFTGK